MHQNNELKALEIPIDSKWTAVEDAHLCVIVRDSNKKDVLIEVMNSMVVARGTLSPKPQRNLMSIKNFKSTFRPA
ncbi:MAG: hypothetical protein J6N72_05980 [Psychrobacter sp.]|nr:hypothetical protein [Psychrobacter sp.]